jgi:pimeloyl-ACP methyl ester carboxylesterase
MSSKPPFEPKTRTIDGLRIRYAVHDEKRADTLLLLSPWPESIYAFAQMWRGLASRFNLLALDLPGFGQSQGREDLFGPRSMGEFIATATSELGIQGAHAVGPDIGTPSLLFAAHARPDLFRSLVVGAGAAVFPLAIDGFLKTLVEAEAVPAVNPADVIGQFVASIKNYEVPDYVRDDYLASYAGERFGQSAALVRHYPRDLAALSLLLPAIETPVQIIVGRGDPYGLAGDAALLSQQLRRCRLDVLDCGHCAWEELPGDYERIVTAWVTDGSKGA